MLKKQHLKEKMLPGINLLSGYFFLSISNCSSEINPSFKKSVSIIPGVTLFTRIPLEAKSKAIPFTKPLIAPFEAE